MKPLATVMAVIAAILFIPVMWFALAVRAIFYGRGPLD